MGVSSSAGSLAALAVIMAIFKLPMISGASLACMAVTVTSTSAVSPLGSVALTWNMYFPSPESASSFLASES